MQSLKVVLWVWFLLIGSWCTTTTRQPDPLATLIMGNTHQLERITKKAQVHYMHSIVGSQEWLPYPDLNIQIDVPFSQHVYIHYHILTGSEVNHYFITKLLIDGQENLEFRSINGLGYYGAYTGFGQVYLQKGRHTLKVLYATLNGYVNRPDRGWPYAFLKARYYQVAKQPQQNSLSPQFITKKATTREIYRLDSGNQWYQFPDLTLTFYLQFPQKVKITYHIVTQTQSDSHMANRLMIDGQENVEFRSMSGSAMYHTHSKTEQVQLSKGAHNIQVQCRSPGIVQITAENWKDWPIAYLKVTYLQTPQN